MKQGAMLNSYPDSIGGDLAQLVHILSLPEMKDVFQSIYLLPSVFNSDIDRGYSIISYDLAKNVATEEDFEQLKAMGFDMLFDFILNHLSVLSPQFRDILEKGDDSPYADFFIRWNEFWKGYGEMDENGLIIPDETRCATIHRRRDGYPVLMVRYPDGREVPYWNTFFQQVFYPEVDAFDLISITDGQYGMACLLAEHINRSIKEGLTPKTMDWTGYEKYQPAASDYMESRRRYLGQMDVNRKSPLVWKWFDQVMGQLASLGASLIRLDAVFALLKDPVKPFPPNCPENWELLNRITELAASHGLDVLPENHVSYKTGFHRTQWEQGMPCYDYFLPALLLDAMDRGDSTWVYRWAKEQADAGVRTINMLGCHDGIPLKDPRGALPDELVDELEKRLVARGGRKKTVGGLENSEVYQMDIAYYSALECDDRKLALARAVQLFMPAKPQIWYQDLFAGANDLEVFQRDPYADNREINRHNYSVEEVMECLKLPVVKEQLELLRFRNTHPVFSEHAEITPSCPDDHTLDLRWDYEGHFAALHANFLTMEYSIICS